MTTLVRLASSLMLVATEPVARPAGATSAEPGMLPAGVINTDVDRSEWTPPSRLVLDTRTGRYEVTSSQARQGSATRPMPTARRGVLDREQLRAVRTAREQALSEGLLDPVCANGGKPDGEVVVSNAGTPALSLGDDRGTVAAPQDLGCWTRGAAQLQDVLETTFNQDRR